MAHRTDTSGFRNFLILLYKGLLVRKRHYIICIIYEFLFPILIACIIAKTQSEANTDTSPCSSRQKPDWTNATFYDPFDPLNSGPVNHESNLLFAYYPENKHTHMLMKNSIVLFKRHHKGAYIVTRVFKDADLLERFCVTEQQRDESLHVIGTIFNKMTSNDDKLPDGLDYTIRYSGAYQGSYFRTNMKYRFYKTDRNEYQRTYFLSWQASVEKTFIDEKLTRETGQTGYEDYRDYEVVMQRFPSPKYKEQADDFGVTVSRWVRYSFMFFIVNLIHRVIEEKANGSKELLKMMGLSNFTYWSSTFTNFFSTGAIVMLIITIIFKVPVSCTALLENSDFFLLLTVFLLFMANLILFCFACTPFINKAVEGVLVVLVIFNTGSFILSTTVFLPDAKYFHLPLTAKLGICLFPPGALTTAFHIISTFEASGEGIQWSNLYNFDADPDMNMSRVLIAMMFSCFLYGIILWYMDAVWPWQYGIPKPFYFPFTKRYWCGYQEEKANEIPLSECADLNDPDFFEEEPTGISPSVVIRNLSKVFKTCLQTNAVVKDVSLNIYNGQITALLGPNGAGKTTTINTLTGLYTPSCGSVSINGWNVFSQTVKARQSLGICPQNSVLYGTLTVEEHLKLYAAIKGVSWNNLNLETQSIMNLMNLTVIRSVLAKNLTRGLQRQLSLGIALIGGSKVLFLDEPTSGMDVITRRALWDFLRKLRHNRTIILTTHHMEEADALGDRIAIMTEGEIQCCGSPMFLKKKFGTGYHLHVVKDANFNLQAFNDVVSKHVPGTSIESDSERDVAFNLASSTSFSLAPLFTEIESKQEEFGIKSYGIDATTLEDVFLNVAKASDPKLQSEETLSAADEADLKDIFMESSGIKGSRNLQNQFYGLIMKRLNYSKRHWGMLISQLILPFCILCCCLISINSISSPRFTTYPPLKLDIQEVYGQTEGFYSSDSESLLSVHIMKYKDKIEEILQNKGVNAKQVSNLNNSILNYAKSSTVDYFKRLIVSGSIKKTEEKLNFTAWYNGAPYHAAPLSLLLMNSAILRSNFRTSYITLTNHPLPYRNLHVFESNVSTTIKKVIASVFVPFALSFLASSFVLVPIQERASKAKLLQLMTGISAAFYWITMFVWDFAMSIIMCTLLILPFALFGRYAFFAPHSEAIGAALLLMILYVWASIPFGYLFSLIFLRPNVGYCWLHFTCIVTGAFLPAFCIYRVGSQGNITVHSSLWILKILPSYTLSSGFGNLFGVAYSNAFCESLKLRDFLSYCDSLNSRIFKCCGEICGNQCLKEKNPFTFDEENGVSWDILFLFIDGILYFVLLFIFESSFVSSVTRMIYQLSKRSHPRINYQCENNIVPGDITLKTEEDFDVLQEEERVRNDYMHMTLNEALLVQNLSKNFKGRKAVDRLNFGVRKKECFGLLGMNGAGKSTIFRILTGDCYPTEGNAYIGQLSLKTHLKEFQSHIGYCPQFDPLIDKLSGRETITLFGRLRGLSGLHLERTVNSLIKMTDLSKHADEPSEVYSGGTKRKLSIALALIGSPPLILLDDPTAGVDPISRRKIWKIISLARIYTGASFILSSHSMEECEALCSRLSILVNGRFRCLGSVEQMKTKNAKICSIALNVRIQSDSRTMNPVRFYFDTSLDGATALKIDKKGELQYYTINPPMRLSKMFQLVEDKGDVFEIMNVASNTSLEHVFLAHARPRAMTAQN